MIRTVTRLLFAFLIATCTALSAKAQCDTTYVNGDMTQSSSNFLSGTYIVDGTFHVLSGVTVFVGPLEFGGCGKLEVYADNIIIDGEINGDNSGHLGGAGGNGGSAVTSLTGNAASIDGCSGEDDTGHLSVEGGISGSSGQGEGGGITGNGGSSGSGPKQDCDFWNDEAGMVGGSGGAGGGGGGSYGGQGAESGSGGNGSNEYSNDDVLVSEAYTVLSGPGGAGGDGGPVNGTATGDDIHMGSGGAGAGGGGRAFVIGQPGGVGGTGGGSVLLNATDSMVITGIITVNGSSGDAGGAGSDGGISPDCCSDPCDDCGEITFSCGAGGGAGAGGGSGGGILLDAGDYISITGLLNAVGGNGGVAGSNGLGTTCSNSFSSCNNSEEVTTGDASEATDGGGGSGGRIKVFYFDCPANSVAASTQVSGGSGGSTSAESGTFEMISTPCMFVSIEERSEEKMGFSIYADHITGTLHLQLLAGRRFGGRNFTMQIMDATGRSVKSNTIQLYSNRTERIPISDLPYGIYFLRLYDGQNMISEKFLWK